MIDSVAEAEARRRYQSGPWFTVAVGDDLAVSPSEARNGKQGIPEFSLELEPGASVVNTHFYDVNGSLWLIYHFKAVDARLFLAEVVRYEYPYSPRFYRQNESTMIETISYTPDGVTMQAEHDTVSKRRRVTERDQVDVAPHWEPVSEFGNWAGLGRLDRA